MHLHPKFEIDQDYTKVGREWRLYQRNYYTHLLNLKNILHLIIMFFLNYKFIMYKNSFITGNVDQ